ncbi:MAG TPA: GNAT family N-acetyltransferase [Bacteroidota bacterium]|nr:GNAT family N-acetyltransferase [Bacteroidota bacterium]
MKKQAFTIRRASPQDWRTIADVIWKTWVDAYSSFIPTDDLHAYHETFYSDDALKKLLDDPHVAAFVAEAGTQIVGVMRTRFNRKEQRYYVSSLYILPDCQGAGIGRGLMRKAADEATSYGEDRLWLGVMVKNRRAFEWYTGMGFQVSETAPFKMGNTTVDHYIGFLTVEDVRMHTQAPPQ